MDTIPVGWRCPQCGAIWSPDTKGCETCNEESGFLRPSFAPKRWVVRVDGKGQITGGERRILPPALKGEALQEALEHNT